MVLNNNKEYIREAELIKYEEDHIPSNFNPCLE